MTTPLRAALDGISGILVTPLDAHDRIAPARRAARRDRLCAAHR
ncbi:hypothetical protein [Cupriavidus pauculus]|nr:hypothetical protein [Cupriavidus pauculus]